MTEEFGILLVLVATVMARAVLGAMDRRKRASERVAKHAREKAARQVEAEALPPVPDTAVDLDDTSQFRIRKALAQNDRDALAARRHGEVLAALYGLNETMREIHYSLERFIPGEADAQEKAGAEEARKTA